MVLMHYRVPRFPDKIWVWDSLNHSPIMMFRSQNNVSNQLISQRYVITHAIWNTFLDDIWVTSWNLEANGTLFLNQHLLMVNAFKSKDPVTCAFKCNVLYMDREDNILSCPLIFVSTIPIYDGTVSYIYQAPHKHLSNINQISWNVTG